MKWITIVSCFIFSLGFLHMMQAQGIAINEDGSLPDSSAILDVRSNNKGILIPRMTVDERNGIPDPATGLLIYQTDLMPGYYYYNGTSWVSLYVAGISSPVVNQSCVMICRGIPVIVDPGKFVSRFRALKKRSFWPDM